MVSKNIILTKVAIVCMASALSLIGACSYNQTDTSHEQTQSSDLRSRTISQQQAASALAEKQKANLEVDQISVTGSRIATSQVVFNDTYLLQENYKAAPQNAVYKASQNPVSTFSVDVDTGSYTNVRRMLNQGYLPPQEAVRTEEFINYFDYHYDVPKSTSSPFSVTTLLSKHPVEKGKALLQIGIKGYNSTKDTGAKVKNLVFLLDVSGSMSSNNKLPLVKKAMKLLVSQLSAKDHIAIVVYAGASGVVLEPTSAANKFAIDSALNKLSAGGSTNGGQGIELAYQLARQQWDKDGINRVIIATDGDFNVGTVDHKRLVELISRNRQHGIGLTTLGVGTGNYNDHLMEQLADAGNGHYAYIDSLNEARKVLVEQLDATMQVIASDVKIQVEFNPSQVKEYRLIGYRNRQLDNAEFANDKVDAGEIGAGHQVTAFYEVTLANSQSGFLEPLRYGTESKVVSHTGLSNEVAQVRLRYKLPGQQQSQRMALEVGIDQLLAFEQQTGDFRFAFAVAEFAEMLSGSQYSTYNDFSEIQDLAIANRGEDLYGYRSEFISLIKLAISLQDIHSMKQIESRDATDSDMLVPLFYIAK